jgi:hypothetical protein
MPVCGRQADGNISDELISWKNVATFAMVRESA